MRTYWISGQGDWTSPHVLCLYAWGLFMVGGVTMEVGPKWEKASLTVKELVSL